MTNWSSGRVKKEYYLQQPGGTLVFTTFFAFFSIGCTALLGSFFFPATRA
jgi:hypothetical protein